MQVSQRNILYIPRWVSTVQYPYITYLDSASSRRELRISALSLRL